MADWRLCALVAAWNGTLDAEVAATWLVKAAAKVLRAAPGRRHLTGGVQRGAGLPGLITECRAGTWTAEAFDCLSASFAV